MPAVTAARYADQDMCYINRRPSGVVRKFSHRPATADLARQMSLHPEAAGANGARRHHSVLMDPSVKNYQKLVKSAKEFMSDEIEKLPLSKYDQLLHPQEISPISLLFREKKWEREVSYIKEHDPLFKFYIAAAFVILFNMGAILVLTEEARQRRKFVRVTMSRH